MSFKKVIALLLSTSIISQSVSPAFAMHHTIEDVKRSPIVSSRPAPLTFQSEAGKTAAGVLHYAHAEGRTFVLLGLRNDQGTYCNFGGGSENEEGKETTSAEKSFPLLEEAKKILSTLAHTADREVREESNGIFAHHPRLLCHQPFIDTFDPAYKGGFLHRMYWQRVQHVHPEKLMEAMNKATDAHSKEYRGFQWVPVEDLLKAVSNHSQVTLAGGDKITLFEPLRKTLATPSGLHFLQNLMNNGKLLTCQKNHRLKENLHVFQKDTFPFLNRLYYLGAEPSVAFPASAASASAASVPSVEETWRVHWDLPDVYRLSSAPLAFGEDAFGRKGAIRTIRDGASKYSQNVHFSTQANEDTFAYAVAAHGAALVELKKKWSSIKESLKKPPLQLSAAPTACISESEQKQEAAAAVVHDPLTPSQIHLLMVLGKDYKRSHDFSAASNPQRAADLANTEEYIKRYAMLCEFKRKVNFLASDQDCVADILAWERSQQWPVFYHAATAEISQLWKSFTALREMITLASLNHTRALRGHDLYFKNGTTMADVLKHEGYGDYGGREKRILCGNYALLAGRATTSTSSSSIGYFVEDHSVIPPNVEAMFIESTALSGFTGDFSYYHSLFKQFLSQHLSLNNSVMLGISVNPLFLDSYTYSAHGGGRPFEAEDADGKKTDKVAQALHNLQEEARRLCQVPEDFSVDSARKQALFPEMRLLIHPDIMYNPDIVRIGSFSRFPLTDIQNRDFEKEMQRVSVAFFADWLAQETAMMPDSFPTARHHLSRKTLPPHPLASWGWDGSGAFLQDPATVENRSKIFPEDPGTPNAKSSFPEGPSLKVLYKLAYKGISGTEPEEGFAKESFFHLIHQEHLEGVKEFHTLYPSILQQANISEEELTHAALKSNNAGILKYCIENILKTTVSKQIPPHMVSLTINDMAKKDLGMLAYILSNYDLSQASKQTKLNWVKHILENGKITKELGIILALFPDLMPDILEMLPGAFVCQEQNGAHIALFEGLLAHQVPLQRVLELYASYVGEGEPKGLSQVAPLAFLMTRGADFFATDPVDGEVLLFKVLRNMAFSLDRDTFSTHVASNPKLLTVRSREGWGIVEFLQRHFMEGKSDSLSYPYGFPSLKLDISTLGGNYAQESYALYTDQGAPTYSNPFRHTDTRQWLEALRRANSSEEWRTLARTCPSSDDVLFLKERAQDNQPLALAELPMPGWYRGYQQAKQWAEKVTAAFTKENAEDGSHLIAEEVYLEDCEFGPLIQLMEENEIFRPLVAQFHEKRKALRQEIEAWEEAVKLACASGDFKAVQNSLQAMPPVIPHSVAEALGSLIKNMPSNLSMEELEGILETRRQEIEGWKQGIQQALSAPEPDLKRLATYLEVAPSMKELSQYVGNFMEEEVLALFPNVLRRLYTTPDTFMNENKVIKTGPYGTVSGPSSLLLHALYLNTSVAPQVINAILDHAETLGVITPLLTRLKESEFFHLLHVLNGEKIRYLLQTHPGVFLHKSKTQDFFAAALDKLPKDLKNDFIMQHQYKLKERTVRKALSVPYFWILFSELNEQLLGTLIQNDPALLDLKTEDGFSPIEVIDSVNLSAKTKKRAKSLLENPQHVDAEAKPLSQDAFGVEKKDPHG